MMARWSRRASTRGSAVPSPRPPRGPRARRALPRQAPRARPRRDPGGRRLGLPRVRRHRLRLQGARRRRQARGRSSALASLGAVACLFAGLLLVARLLRMLGVIKSEEPASAATRGREASRSMTAASPVLGRPATPALRSPRSSASSPTTCSSSTASQRVWSWASCRLRPSYAASPASRRRHPDLAHLAGEPGEAAAGVVRAHHDGRDGLGLLAEEGEQDESPTSTRTRCATSASSSGASTSRSPRSTRRGRG